MICLADHSGSATTTSQIAFFDHNEGGPAEAGIAIIKQTKGLTYQLVAQSPLIQLQPYFGETAQFPITGAEDFSFVLEEVPGAFVFLGACPPDRDPVTAPTNHSAVATFDDLALAEGTALYTELALRRLAQG